MSGKIANWIKTHPTQIRLIAGVAAGIVFTMIASIATHEILHLCGIMPPLHKPMFSNKLITLELIYHSIYAIIGAMFTARIAKEKAMKAAFLLGSKEAIMWLLGIILLWNRTFAWYNLTKAALGIPLALLGGFLYKKYAMQRMTHQKTRS
jgi:hypothetical protein